MGLSHTYLRYTEIEKNWQRKAILRRLEISVKGGSCLLITGENGSGKSTLLRIMSGLLKPEKFNIQFKIGACATNHGESMQWRGFLKAIRHHVMYLHQTPYLFDRTVEKNLHYVESDLSVTEAMDWAGIRHLARHKARGLSGGEAQRVALARAWLKQPKVLLLDEPTANLDVDSRRRTIELLGHFKEQGMAIAVASHDPVHFRKVVDRQCHLNNGEMSEVRLFENTDNLIKLSPRVLPTYIDSDIASAI